MYNSKFPTEIIVASGNLGKIAEFKEIVPEVNFKSMRQAGYLGDPDETGSTYKENAYIKAKAVYDAIKKPVIADDSGLCVDALGGAPGIYSARFSGGSFADNRALLLKRMEGISDRGARFVCAVCYINEKGETLFGEGSTEGKILFEEIGNKGFGYDNLFYSFDLNKSFGEADEEEKNKVSHRYRAVKDLFSKLQ
ncbi:MAG: RdgB/HAM1 family non-canonical purine NTP pyrophosphatase [Candidatus Coproplasma sp.]